MKTILYVNGEGELITHSFEAFSDDVPDDKGDLKRYVLENSPFPADDIHEIFVFDGTIEAYFTAEDLDEG